MNFFQSSSYSVICLLFLLNSNISYAANWVVNDFSDGRDIVPGDGYCETVTLQCTLRAAIQETNAQVGDDEIFLPNGVYRLDIAGTGEDQSRLGDLDICDNLRIRGENREHTIVDGNHLDRVFDIKQDTVISNCRSVVLPRVVMRNLTIQNGYVAEDPPLTYIPSANLDTGGGINNHGDLELQNVIVKNNLAASVGGGIYSDGDGGLTIYSSRITENTSGTSPDVTVSGRRTGGIFTNQIRIMQSQVTDNIGIGMTVASSCYSGTYGVIDETLITRNHDNRPNPLSRGYELIARGCIEIRNSSIIATNLNNKRHGIMFAGGGRESSPLKIINSTIRAEVTAGPAVDIYGQISIEHSTFTGNVPSLDGLLRYNCLETNFYSRLCSLRLKDSIIANNTDGSGSGNNCIFPRVGIRSFGNNIATDASCELTASGDMPMTDPMLDSLRNNGGLTPTHALFAGSPAIDAASITPTSSPCPIRDQRGETRPRDGDGDGTIRCDIGAYEHSGVATGDFSLGGVADELFTRLPCSVGSLNPDWGSVGRNYYPFCPGNDLLTVEIPHPQIQGIVDCFADGPGCLQYFVIDWPEVQDTFDMAFQSKAKLQIDLLDVNGKVVSSAELTEIVQTKNESDYQYHINEKYLDRSRYYLRVHSVASVFEASFLPLSNY